MRALTPTGALLCAARLWFFCTLGANFDTCCAHRCLRGSIDPAHPDPGGKDHSVPWCAILCTLFNFTPLRSLVDFTKLNSRDCLSWDTLTWEQAEHAMAYDSCEKRGPLAGAIYSSAAGAAMGRDLWSLHRPTRVSLRSEQMQSWCHRGLISERKVNSSANIQ